MPGFVGQALCRRGPEFGMPSTELVFVRPDFTKYTAVAEVARQRDAPPHKHSRCMQK